MGYNGPITGDVCEDTGDINKHWNIVGYKQRDDICIYNYTYVYIYIYIYRYIYIYNIRETRCDINLQ